MCNLPCKIGDTVTYHVEYCVVCQTYIGGATEATYVGHVTMGSVYHKFALAFPRKCPTCGELGKYGFTPCEDGPDIDVSIFDLVSEEQYEQY